MSSSKRRRMSGSNLEGGERVPPEKRLYNLKQNVLGEGLTWEEVMRQGLDEKDYRKMTCSERKSLGFFCDEGCDCPQVQPNGEGKSKRCSNFEVNFETTYESQLYLFDAGQKGWGVKCSVDIKAGQFITEGKGEVVSGAEYLHRQRTTYRNMRSFNAFSLMDGFMCDPAGDGKGNIARYVNHDCGDGCNAVMIPYRTKGNKEMKLMLLATEDIDKDTEILRDYGEYVEGCCCGSSNCSTFLKNYECTEVGDDGVVCGFQSNRYGRFKQHVQFTHIKTGYCNVCELWFANKFVLQKHIKRKPHKNKSKRGWNFKKKE